MPPSLIARLRASRDLRSAGRALALLFLLTGILGAFASGSATAAIDSGNAAIHCLSGSVADDDGGFDLACCTLGCAMVTVALPAPSAAAVSVPDAPASTAIRHPSFVAPPAILAAGESPRGPPTA